MNAPTGGDLRAHWIAKAKLLDQEGYFAAYSQKQRVEVLTKGFLGRYPPDEAVRMARRHAEQGHCTRTGRFNDDMRNNFGLVGEEARKTLLQILEEIPPVSYKPPRELHDPPGCPFIYASRVLGREVYFKFQIVGTPQKPQVLFWSCKPPLY
jgi:hypothetical protein